MDAHRSQPTSPLSSSAPAEDIDSDDDIPLALLRCTATPSPRRRRRRRRGRRRSSDVASTPPSRLDAVADDLSAIQSSLSRLSTADATTANDAISHRGPETARTSRRINDNKSELDPLRRTLDASYDSVDRIAASPSKGYSFDDRNEAYVPPLGTNLPPIPAHIKEIISKVMREGRGIKNPRDYQLEAIFQFAYRKKNIYLIRKCGEGKSAVLQTACLLLRGIVICLVPLIGLGSDQVNKSKNLAVGGEAYHADEFRGTDHDKLEYRLRKYRKGDKSSILIFISPKELVKDTSWQKTIRHLAKQGLISAFCVDEVHTVVDHGESFRPEFPKAIDSIIELIYTSRKLHPTLTIPFMAMSATFRIPEQQRFNKLTGQFPDFVSWGRMDKRNVGIFNRICGSPVHAILNDWERDVTANPDGQSLVYSNSAKACDESLLLRLEARRDKLPKELSHTIDGELKEILALTGECGIMLKSYLMAVFCGEDIVEGLRRVWSMPCTSAAECGLSSKRCSKCYRCGSCPNWHNFVQEMGRVDRAHSALLGEHNYVLYQDVPLFLQLWLRCMR